jgi:hypothetical protein
MSSVGIVANPASSKDIRRVVAHATTVSNHEKVNIVRRVLLGLAATAVDQVWYMPDSSGLVFHAADRLDLPFNISALEGDWDGTVADTIAAARQLAALGVGCMITLGGDGTVRAAVKGSRDLPIMPLSTGTNNAFPVFLEGTLAGLAAGTVATIAPQAVAGAPLLELWRNDEAVDVALVDVAAVSDNLGGRAVWEIERVRALVTTRTRPGTVGLSAIGGHIGSAPPPDALAIGLTLGPGRTIHAPIAPGVIAPIGVAAHIWLAADATFDLPTGTVLALDGEREVNARAGERWQVRVVADGVAVVDVEAALAASAMRESGPYATA